MQIIFSYASCSVQYCLCQLLLFLLYLLLLQILNLLVILQRSTSKSSSFLLFFFYYFIQLFIRKLLIHQGTLLITNFFKILFKSLKNSFLLRSSFNFLLLKRRPYSSVALISLSLILLVNSRITLETN